MKTLHEVTRELAEVDELAGLVDDLPAAIAAHGAAAVCGRLTSLAAGTARALAEDATR